MNAISPNISPQTNHADSSMNSAAGAKDIVIHQQRCQRCLNHGEIRIRKYHACLYKNRHHTQSCAKCELIDMRRFYNRNINDAAAEEILVDDNEPVDAAPAASRLKPGARSLTCVACRLHGEIFPLRGHRLRCKYSMCKCSKCELVRHRRAVMAAQVKLRRDERMQQLLQEQFSRKHSSNAMLSSRSHHINHYHPRDTSLNDMPILDMFNDSTTYPSQVPPTPNFVSPQFSSHDLPLQLSDTFRPDPDANFSDNSSSQELDDHGGIDVTKVAAAEVDALGPLPSFANLPSSSASAPAAKLMHLFNFLCTPPVVGTSDSPADSTASSIIGDSTSNSQELSRTSWSPCVTHE